MVRTILDWCITSSALIALVLVLRRLVGQRVSDWHQIKIINGGTANYGK